ncbi:MAG: bifunctional diaminohydroxyphosphoribosylaminopyrimidine deaminase/5-amino-6-(5-phosphoribosylamino)uracil reductase RibD [Planctomycetota bacterium]
MACDVEHSKWMQLALELARRGRGAVEPNPMVGAVIVRDGQVIGQGWHEKYGGPHAEPNAVRAAWAAGFDPAGATMYVTLEPCSHHGKTPPCADLLIQQKLARVVIAHPDPDRQVNGGGIARLRAAGIDVQVGCCQAQARVLLREYLTLRTLQRPWVICKWAQTADGYLALPPEDGRWISCEESRRQVHQLRAICDAILVGIGTVLADDPLLTNRSGAGKTLTRVVLDSRLRIPLDSQLVQSAAASPLLVVCDMQAQTNRQDDLRAAGAEVLALPAPGGRIDLQALLGWMGDRQWTRLLVEGGAQVHRSFLAAGLADQVQAYEAPLRIGPGRENLPQLDVAQLGLEHLQRRPSGCDSLHEAVLGIGSEHFLRNL